MANADPASLPTNSSKEVTEFRNADRARLFLNLLRFGGANKEEGKLGCAGKVDSGIRTPGKLACFFRSSSTNGSVKDECSRNSSITLKVKRLFSKAGHGSPPSSRQGLEYTSSPELRFPLCSEPANGVGVGAPHIGVGAHHVGLGAPLISVGAPPVCAIASPLGTGALPTAVSAPPIGVGGPPIGVGAPHIAVDGPPIGMGAPHIAVDGPLIGMGAPHIAVDGPPIGMGAPHIALGGPPIGVGAPPIAVCGPPIGVGAPHIAVGGPLNGAHAPRIGTPPPHVHQISHDSSPKTHTTATTPMRPSSPNSNRNSSTHSKSRISSHSKRESSHSPHSKGSGAEHQQLTGLEHSTPTESLSHGTVFDNMVRGPVIANPPVPHAPPSLHLSDAHPLMRPGLASPQLGLASLQLGLASPQLGLASPQVGLASPQLARSSLPIPLPSSNRGSSGCKEGRSSMLKRAAPAPNRQGQSPTQQGQSIIVPTHQGQNSTHESRTHSQPCASPKFVDSKQKRGPQSGSVGGHAMSVRGHSAKHSNAASSSRAPELQECQHTHNEVEMLWPLCLTSNCGEVKLKVKVNSCPSYCSASSTRYRTNLSRSSAPPAPPAHGPTSAPYPPLPPPSVVSVVAAATGEQLAQQMVSLASVAKFGISSAQLVPSFWQSARFSSLSAPLASNLDNDANTKGGLALLTVFSSSDGEAGESGPACNLLCGPAAVVEELEELFTGLVSDLMDQEDSTTDCLMRDLYGFSFLHGGSRHNTISVASTSSPRASSVSLNRIQGDSPRAFQYDGPFSREAPTLPSDSFSAPLTRLPHNTRSPRQSPLGRTRTTSLIEDCYQHKSDSSARRRGVSAQTADSSAPTADSSALTTASPAQTADSLVSCMYNSAPNCILALHPHILPTDSTAPSPLPSAPHSLHGSFRLDKSTPPWQSPDELYRKASQAAWKEFLHPLIQEIGYLLMCVPVACKPGQWDQNTFMDSMSRMFDFLQHHRMWNTLAAIMVHTAKVGVEVKVQGRAVRRSLQGADWELLLANTLSGDVEMVYMEVATSKEPASNCVTYTEMCSNLSRPGPVRKSHRTPLRKLSKAVLGVLSSLWRVAMPTVRQHPSSTEGLLGDSSSNSFIKKCISQGVSCSNLCMERRNSRASHAACADAAAMVGTTFLSATTLTKSTATAPATTVTTTTTTATVSAKALARVPPAPASMITSAGTRRNSTGTRRNRAAICQQCTRWMNSFDVPRESAELQCYETCCKCNSHLPVGSSPGLLASRTPYQQTRFSPFDRCRDQDNGSVDGDRGRGGSGGDAGSTACVCSGARCASRGDSFDGLIAEDSPCSLVSIQERSSPGVAGLLNNWQRSTAPAGICMPPGCASSDATKLQVSKPQRGVLPKGRKHMFSQCFQAKTEIPRKAVESFNKIWGAIAMPLSHPMSMPMLRSIQLTQVSGLGVGLWDFLSTLLLALLSAVLCIVWQQWMEYRGAEEDAIC
eukprot:gene4634-14830_t